MTTLNAYGDSITKGEQVAKSSPVIFAQKMGWAVNNFGINGARAADIADAVFSTTISANTKNVLAIGINNLDNDLSGVSAATFKLEHMALAARLAVPDSAKVFANSPLLTYSTTGTGWASDSSLSGPGGVTGLKYAMMVGATISFTFTGDTLYLGYTMSNSGGGKASVTVDGVVHPRQMDSNAYGAVSSGFSPARAYSPSFWRANGFGPGTHTCVITTLDANPFRFNYFSTPVAGPELFVHNITRVTTSSLQPFYDTYNNNVLSNISILQGDGLNVHAVDVAGVINATRDLIDGIHPNQLGHYKIANQDIVAAGGTPIELFTPLSMFTSITGDLYAGNDYDKYLIKTGPL